MLDAHEFAATYVYAIRGGIQPSLCGDTLWALIEKQIMQAADIMSDGTQDIAATCDGISIGLGFTAREVQIGTAAAAPVGLPDVCGD